MSTPAASSSPSSRVLNVNIGIVGHVDSGKTSLARALSTHLSTAALDKAPQSVERGITLDLGFSAFYIPAPTHLAQQYDRIQFTLVDCPGHASLIRTMIGGAQIIDVMLLVIDACKGIQTQTAECLVLGEILIDRLIVVVNKVDLLTQREEQQKKLEKGLRQTFKGTKFGGEVEIVYIAANPGATNNNPTTTTSAPSSSISQVQPLIDLLSKTVTIPPRDPSLPLFLSIDHCFAVRGVGTILTGTVLSGSVEVGDTIELPTLKEQRKVKSMQMFHTAVSRCSSGDRVALCVTNLEAALIERGIACAVGSVACYEQLVCVVEKVRFYKGVVQENTKFHLSIGHHTIMAEGIFFAQEKEEETHAHQPPSQEQQRTSFVFDREYPHQSQLFPTDATHPPHSQYALLTLSTPLYLPIHSLHEQIVIAARLDAQQTGKSCRLAFYGNIVYGIPSGADAKVHVLQLYRNKEKIGEIDRIQSNGSTVDASNSSSSNLPVSSSSVIGRRMFKSAEDVNRFVGFVVSVEQLGEGRIEAAFGKGGKFKVQMNEHRSAEKKQPSTSSSPEASSGKSDAKAEGGGGRRIVLRYKQSVHNADGKKKIWQTPSGSKS